VKNMIKGIFVVIGLALVCLLGGPVEAGELAGELAGDDWLGIGGGFAMLINAQSLNALRTNIQTTFNKGLGTAPTQHEQICMVVNSTAESESYPWFGDIGGMREWLGDRVVHALEGHDYTIKNKKFEKTIGIKADHVEDDKFGLHVPRIQELSRLAATHPSLLAFQLLKNGFNEKCFDGQYFFDTDHPVGDGSVSNMQDGAGDPWFLLDLSRVIKPLILQIRRKARIIAMHNPNDPSVWERDEFQYGVDDRKNVGFGLWQLAWASKADMTHDNFEIGVSAMGSLKNDNGEPLGVGATHLVHMPKHEGKARRICISELKTDGSSNEWKGAVEMLKSPWLA